MTSLAHNAKNDTRFDDLVKDIRQFGRDAAEGKDALPKLAIRVISAADDGVISTYDPKVHGKDNPDDAAKIYEEYATSESKKAIHEHSAGGLKANVSKLRQLITFGSNPNCDAMAVTDKALKVRKELSDADIKVKGAYPALVDIARAQNAQDTELTDEQIRETVAKGEAEEPTVEKELTAIHKRLERLITGEKGPQDQDPLVIQAEEAIRARLAAMVMARETMALMEKAAELGMVFTLPEQAAA